MDDDDYDPLAPVLYRDADEDDEPGDDPGSHDPDRIVRVWLDEGRLSRVRVSPVWHLKVREKTLDDCFAAALAAAHVRIAPAVPDAGADLTGVDFHGLPDVGRTSLATYRTAVAGVRRRWQDALERQRVAPVERHGSVEVEHEGVTARLDDDGHLVAIRFDEDFLEDATTREIADGVLAAAGRAHGQFERTTPRDDELSLLAREHEILMRGLASTLSGKGRDDE